MNLSKTTFWRILEQARFKLARALVENKPIRIVSSRGEMSVYWFIPETSFKF